MSGRCSGVRLTFWGHCVKPGILAYGLMIVGGAVGALYVPLGFLVLGIWSVWPRRASSERY